MHMVQADESDFPEDNLSNIIVEIFCDPKTAEDSRTNFLNVFDWIINTATDGSQLVDIYPAMQTISIPINRACRHSRC